MMDMLTQLINEHLKSKNIYEENPPWVIKNSSVSGRGLFASRDVQAGEVIFKDNALIIGPRANPSSPVICVNCYEISNLHACPKKCGLPVCSEKCSNSAVHKRECEVICSWKNGHNFSEISVKLLKSLTPVRSLFLTDNQRELLKCLQSHDGPQHGFEVDVLRQGLQLNFNEEEERSMRITCAVMDANSFEVIVGNEKKQSGLRGLYPLSSLMNHNCVPNTMHNFDCNQNMVVKATTFIPEGEEIFHSYTRMIWGTSVRRSHLVRTKHFYCTCKRCEDPSEFGTNLSALYCAKCRGFVLPFFDKKRRITWKCVLCNEVLPSVKAGLIIGGLGSRLNCFNTADAEPQDILKYTKGQFLKFAPSCSQIAAELKYKLVWMLGSTPKYQWRDLSEDLLIEKEVICRELLQLLIVLGAGQSKMRGLLLYELYLCLKERKRRTELQEVGEKYTGDLEKMSKEMEQLFHESRLILLEDVHAPPEIANYNVVNNGTSYRNGVVHAA